VTRAQAPRIYAETSKSEPFDISVVIPAHDAMPWVLDAVDSGLSQTMPPGEVVIVDDGSSDGTAEAILQRYGGRPGVRVVRGRFGGAAAARNAGWRAATRPWVGFLDADDVWFPEKLATAAATLQAFPFAGWFFSDGTYRPLEGTEWRSWLAAYADVREPYVGHPIAQLFEVNFVLTSSVVVRRSLLKELKGFDARMSHAEDLDLWIRLARRAPAAAAARPLVRYHVRPTGLTRQIERRLMGDVELFERLARDPELSPTLRRRARRREALAHFKLAFDALRAGRRRATWSRLPKAWMFPERAFPVGALALVSLLPAAWLRALARRGLGAHPASRRAFALARVALHADPIFLAAAERGVAS